MEIKSIKTGFSYILLMGESCFCSSVIFIFWAFLIGLRRTVGHVG